MAVNTPSGLTDREKVENSVLQGETWGSLLASVQVETIGKKCEELGYGYNYKNSLYVGILGLVDDIIAVTEAGPKAHVMNVFLNVKTAEKSLQYGVKKCKTMIIGEDTENILNPKLFVDKWVVQHKEDATGETKLEENFVGQVEIEKSKEQKYLGFRLSS